MAVRARAAGALAAGAVALVTLGAVSASGGDGSSDYAFKVQLDNALGLRDGSLVTVGGVEIGKVDVDLGDRDQVTVEAKLDEGQGPVGRDVKAFITSVNLLGQKRLELVKGDAEEDPLPSGSSIPAKRVTQSTDLDEVLAVLSPDVRTRLRVLVNEAGAAVVGRDADVAQLIETLPPTIAKATEVVDRVTGDNETLARVLERSDRVVASLASERAALNRLVDSAGKAAGSVQDKRAELQATLDRAPATLRTLRGFLGELERATVPLGPAARDLKATAPELVDTMEQLEPFRQAANPALAEVRSVAPALTKLADGATPVIKQAVPTLGRLATVAQELVPVTDTLDKSVSNLIGTIDNWSRAVQYRDGLSHIFRGEPTLTPQTLEGVLGRYMKLLEPAKKKTKQRKATKDRPARTPELPKAKLPELKLPKLPTDKLPPVVGETVGKVVDGVQGLLDGVTRPKDEAPAGGSQTQKLLDFLLKP